MIFLTLLIDLLFYNYTSVPTYFFLLSFLNTNQRVIWILFLGFIWDFFILHTNGYFLLLFILLFVVSNIIKNIDKLKIIKFIILHLIYFGFVWIFFDSLNNIFIGAFLNFLIVLLGNCFNSNVI